MRKKSRKKPVKKTTEKKYLKGAIGSKSSDLDKVVKKYIIDSIDSSGYGVDPKSPNDKVKFLYDTFLSEYGWAVQRMGMQRALKEWISGAPSSLAIEYDNYGILQLAKKWGSLPENPTEKQEDKILDNYFNFMSAKILQLFNKVNKGQKVGYAKDRLKILKASTPYVKAYRKKGYTRAEAIKNGNLDASYMSGKKHTDIKSHNYTFHISGTGKNKMLETWKSVYGRLASELIMANTSKEKNRIKKEMIIAKNIIKSLEKSI